MLLQDVTAVSRILMMSSTDTITLQEGADMRSSKQQDEHQKAASGRFLPPALDLRLSNDLQKALNVNPSRTDARLHVSLRPLRAPVLSCDSELTPADRGVFSLPVALPVGMVGDLGPQAYRIKRAAHSAGSASLQSKAALTYMRGKRLNHRNICVKCSCYRTHHNTSSSGDTGSLRDSSVPCFLTAFSFRDDITSCPERLDLDRRGLTNVPRLDGAENLRLLNMQHNLISHLQDLLHLQRLVFLDLHDNRVIDMSGISSLTSLRVLLLGKNRIQRICDVDGLTKLDVLDLHSNQTDVENLPRLQRLFLSANSISSELSVDGNPVALESCYRQTLLRCCSPHLQLLDMKRVTERRRLAIQNAAQQWEGLKACLELPAQNGTKEDVSPDNSPAHSPAQTNGNTQETSPDEPKRLSPLTVSAGGNENRLRSTSRPNSPRDPRPQDAGGPSVQSLSMSDSHLAELDGETLRLFGPGALETLERCWGVQTAASVTTVAFRYIHFDSIIPIITHLPQLAALAQVRRLEQISVHSEGNPVVGLTLWRSFLIYRLQHLNLQKINGTEVTMNEIMASERMFGALGHVAATETPRCRLLLLLEESRCTSDCNSSPHGFSPKSDGRSDHMNQHLSVSDVLFLLHVSVVLSVRCRKRQLQFLLDGRGRRSGQSPEELKENGKQLGDGLSRALFNYPSRLSDGPEVRGALHTPTQIRVAPRPAALTHLCVCQEGGADAAERSGMVQQYLRGLIHRASGHCVKADALQKIWPSLFSEIVRDAVLEMRDRQAFRHTSLQRLHRKSQT
ncbi:Leucine-rich repeat-containing protein 49 [Labeo rohita]|uniref:Leucine-rich repeat-containing protein 49 n=1 Tax=Labeo rohita TaxID=84645 RepID=A0ABQ8LRN5_LABRO|nr:Leucine-rich repeat-containing protein 49 [Labeo rohita]